MPSGFIESAQSYLRSKLSPTQKVRLKKFAAKTIARSGLFRNLSSLAILHGSDKYGGHFYTPHYQQHFAPLRRRKINLLEIGIGGYSEPANGGASLRMWKSYFSRANIH